MEEYKLKFAFMTCVQLGLSCIEEIYESGGKLDLIITIPDDHAPNKSGRIYLDEFSKQHNVPLLKTKQCNDAKVVDLIKSEGIDWLFIIGWSQIAKEALLAAPRLGAIGMHPTLLPQGRGRAAIPWAIIKGLNKTGVTMFKLDTGVDTGPIISQEEIPIDCLTETATSLYKKVNRAHRTLIAKTWPKLVSGKVELRPQDDLSASYWEGRKPKDGEINASMTSKQIDTLVRATTKPYPGAFLSIDEGTKQLRIWSGKPIEKDELEISEADPAIIRTKDGHYQCEQFEILPI